MTKEVTADKRTCSLPHCAEPWLKTENPHSEIKR